MKIAISIYSLEQLEKYSHYIDCAILNVPKKALVYRNLDLDKALEYCREHNIEPIISFNRVVMEDELNEAIEFIKNYSSYKFLISDLGLATAFKELNLIQNVIYDPLTLVCNSMDLDLYSSYGFDAVGMSNEITLRDISAAFVNTKRNIFYQVFGRRLMYYSKRKLVSAYKTYRELNFDNENLTLVEEKRDYHIPLVENENGTFCYRQYFISLLDYLNDLSFLKYAYLDLITLDDDSFEQVLKAYRGYLDKSTSINEAKSMIEELNLSIEEGFNFEDTVHVKEKIIQ